MLKFGTPTIALPLAIKKMYCSDWMHCIYICICPPKSLQECEYEELRLKRGSPLACGVMCFVISSLLKLLVIT